MINKWTIAGVVIAFLLTSYNIIRTTTKYNNAQCDGKISTLQKKHADETIQIQQITIEQLDKNVKTVIKAKKIAENNRNLARDELIDKL